MAFAAEIPRSPFFSNLVKSPNAITGTFGVTRCSPCGPAVYLPTPKEAACSPSQRSSFFFWMSPWTDPSPSPMGVDRDRVRTEKRLGSEVKGTVTPSPRCCSEHLPGLLRAKDISPSPLSDSNFSERPSPTSCSQRPTSVALNSHPIGILALPHRPPMPPHWDKVEPPPPRRHPPPPHNPRALFLARLHYFFSKKPPKNDRPFPTIAPTRPPSQIYPPFGRRAYCIWWFLRRCPQNDLDVCFSTNIARHSHQDRVPLLSTRWPILLALFRRFACTGLFGVECPP